MSVYVESAQAFEVVADPLARTQVVWALEDLAQRSTLLDQPRQRPVAERH
ncbi:MAG: hypothetical protein GTO63_26110, partial [Anaerolineae bacterium]|nr:hypothetical protein [Anaerolineae bacterium]NIN98211.1 hypothetical protein [Anaerolineae bacterium]